MSPAIMVGVGHGLGVVRNQVGVVGYVGHNAGVVGVGEPIHPTDHNGTVINSAPEYPPPYSEQPQTGYHPAPSAGPYSPPPPEMVMPTVIVSQHFGSKPIHYTCRSCNKEMITTVKLHATRRTHFFAGLLCLSCCWPCVPIPYCISDFKGAEHYCSKCEKFVGSYNI